MHTKIEQRYCSCIIKAKYPSYALCTHSVYNLQNKKRTKNIECDKIIDFDKYDLLTLRTYAKNKKIKITKNGKYKTKDVLINDLKN
jgi:hypothetical protein